MKPALQFSGPASRGLLRPPETPPGPAPRGVVTRLRIAPALCLLLLGLAESISAQPARSDGEALAAGSLPAGTEHSPSEAAPTSVVAPQRLVICLDGTWNNPYREKERYDRGQRGKKKVLKPTNVLKTCRAVPLEANGVRQLAYYDVGVGALNKYPGAYNRLLRTADSVLGGAWGAGFETRVEAAYRFLTLNYQPGDEIFIFGFSRGAGAARALTRFIDWMGGLPEKGDDYWTPYLFKEYLSAKGEGNSLSARQRIHSDLRDGKLAELLEKDGSADRSEEYERQADAYSKRMLSDPVEVEVRFLGVWDTVLALGSRLKAETTAKAFFVADTPARVVHHARQALALDERRFDFKPAIWRQRAHEAQTLEQRWFAGVHSNIGGGYVKDGLANQALAWMLAEASEQGLVLDWEFLAGTLENHYRPYIQGQLYDSRKWFYRVKEFLTLRTRKGIRPLLPFGEDPKATSDAGLALDCSVLKRIASDPARFSQMQTAYGPTQENLLHYFSRCDGHDAWLANEILGRLNRRGGTRADACLPVAPNVTLTARGPNIPNPECQLTN
jgi:uncharacterized protein (DUF2235 family)